MKKIFRYTPLDTFLFLNTILFFALPYIIAIYTKPSWWWIPIGIIQAFFISNLHNTSLHHQSHWPMFKHSRLNYYYEILISVACASSFTNWKVGHLLHHKYVNDQAPDGNTQDPASLYFGRTDGTPTNFYKFCFLYALVSVKWLFRPLTGVPGLGKVKQYSDRTKLEYTLIRSNLVLLAIINLPYAISLIPVYFLAYAMDRATTYGEHWGVLDRRGDTTQDSNNIEGFWCNFLGFGAGHHQEHHHKPGIHWSRYSTVTPLLSPNRRIIKAPWHMFNCPYWEHFKLLFNK